MNKAPFYVITISLAMLLSACGGGDNLSRVDAGNQEGVLHLGNGTEPQGLDPHIVTGVPEHHIINALFEGLVSKDPNTLEPIPAVAESWDISADGRTYTFHLRQDARWSNGDPITAEDFRWSWQRVLSPELGSQYNYMLYPVLNAEAYANGEIDDFNQVGARVLDSHTFVVELENPTPYLLQLLDHYSTFPVHPPTILAHGSMSDRISQWTRVNNIVSNGPFKLSEWAINSLIRVEKSETYWDTAAVKLNAIVYYPTENTTTEERMFRDEELHFTNTVPMDKISTYQDTAPELLQITPYLGTYYYLINTEKPPFNDLRVRQALAMAIDRDLLTETVMRSTVTPAYALTPPGTLGYQPPRTFNYDPEMAQQLIAEAGFPNGEGFPTFEILYNTLDEHRRIAVAIQEMWRQNLGINVELLNQEWRVYLDTQNNMNYDVSRRGWIGDYVDPNSFLDMMITNGGNNKTGFSDARYDDLVLNIAPTKLYVGERFETYYEAETILMDDMPIIPLYTYQSRHFKHPSLKGLPENILDYYNWKYVYLEAMPEYDIPEGL
jgi:oligopeptide transport system substrate-binding protein